MTALPQTAVEIARPFGLPITNSMVVTWIVAIVLIMFAQLATRNMKQVPGGRAELLGMAGGKSCTTFSKGSSARAW